MKIGFTGSRKGMTDIQKSKFLDILRSCNPSEFHHGCCLGSDMSAHCIAGVAGFKIVAHPPTNKNCYFKPVGASEVRADADYLVRNKNIVDQTDLLLATPDTSFALMRSGTWSTIRYAEKQKKNYVIIYPDGSTSLCAEF